MRLPVTCINPLFVITLSKDQLYCAMDKLHAITAIMLKS